jgi:hypothetical protein
MGLTSGFFNGVANDRTYDALQMSMLFDGIITDGIFSSIGTAMVVTPAAGMNINVGIGRAWFNRTWTYNDSIMSLPVQISEVVLNRIDVVVLEVDTSDAVRANSIKVIKGTPATTPVAPTLVHTSTVNQYPLAHLSVLAGVTTIAPDKITNKVGTVDCPFITGVLESLDIATFLAQWNAEFDIWFDEMKGQLSVDAAGSLQVQIDALEAVVDVIPRKSYRNLFVNGDCSVATRGNNFTGISSQLTYPVDKFRFVPVTAAGAITLSQELLANGEYSIKALVTTAKASLAAADFGVIAHMIESLNLQKMQKGTVNAKKTVLSFDFMSNLTGTFVVEIRDNPNLRTIHKTFSVNAPNVWERKSFVIDGDTVGSLPSTNVGGINVIFNLYAGSNLNSGVGSLNTNWGAAVTNCRAKGQTNFLSAVNNYVQYKRLQFEVSDFETPFEDIDPELQKIRCKRYCRSSFPYGVKPVQNYGQVGAFFGTLNKTGATSNVFTERFDVPMRSIPSVTFYNPQAANAQFRDYTALADFSGTQLSALASESLLAILAMAPAGSTIGNHAGVHYLAEAEV